MSAIAAFRQLRAVHLASDALAYDADGVPVAVDLQKTHVIDGLRAAVSCTGPATLSEDMADRIAGRFATFDALVESGAETFKELFLAHIADWRDGDAVAMMVLAGWHEAADRPGLYAMSMRTDGAKWRWVKEHSTEDEESPAFELAEREVISSPCPRLEHFRAAGYDLRGSFDAKDPATDLVHIMEIQRRIQFDGRHLVGGNVLLTSIDAAGAIQRIVHIWADDVEGEAIKPATDWAAWNLQRAGVDLSGLSPLKRKMLEKRARKGTLRVVA